MATKLAELLDKQLAPAPKKPRQGRSPAFPFIPLGKALERAEALRVAEGGRPKHFSPWGAIAKAWDLGEKTGPMKQTMAALGYFGLFEFDGSGETRSARPTDIAFKILLDKQPASPERDKLIQLVALTPAAHKDLWNKWPGGLPSDPTVETYLVRDRSFSEDGAKDLIAEYKATLAFAKLTEPGTIPDAKTGQSEHPVPPKVGDFVQVEINGALQFDKPQRVRAIQEHEGKDWVFVEGSETGVLMEQVQIVKEGGAGGGEPPRLAFDELPPEWREERLLDDAGEEIFIRYKGEPSKARYGFIRDYLDFKMNRLK
jgi:hypothetical protein